MTYKSNESTSVFVELSPEDNRRLSQLSVQYKIKKRDVAKHAVHLGLKVLDSQQRKKTTKERS